MIRSTIVFDDITDNKNAIQYEKMD